MTPGARVAAAIEILDAILAGSAAERALTVWARGSRFAGSKDRAAVRDHVFDVLRAKRSLGDGTGRALMIALCLRQGIDPDGIFSGEGHAPTPLTRSERQTYITTPDLSQAAACDVPEWLWPQWQASLGDQAVTAALAQQGRAPVYLRVNGRRGDVAGAIAMLLDDGVVAMPHDKMQNCLRVIENERKIKNAKAYLDGYVELQDAASQVAVAGVDVPENGTVLDYCAGGGGKALAFADRTNATVFAHDIAPERMRDINARAARAAVRVTQVATADLAAQAPFDVVFCDAPCSGSGTWRRAPDAKWRLTRDKLNNFNKVQHDVIVTAAALVGPNGTLTYATCSVLKCENDDVVAWFVQTHPEWQIIHQKQLYPGEDWDGFFTSSLKKR